MGLKLKQFKAFYKQRKFFIFLCLLLLISAFFYNYTNIWGHNWFKHPDETGTYLMGKHLYETGNLEMEADLNNKFKTSAFTPAALFYNGKKIVPLKAYGVYFLNALGFSMGQNGPFYLITLMALLSTVFLYLIVSNLFNEKIASLSCTFWSLSFPMIYWANSIYANIPALAFFIIGLYFLIRITKNNEHKYLNYILMGLFLSISIFTRYEYIIFTLLLLPIFIKFFKKFRKIKLLLILILFIVVITHILILNSRFYGSPFALAYTMPKLLKMQEQNSNINGVQYVTQNTSLGNKLKSAILGITQRFLMQDLSPNWQRIFDNFNNSIFKISPLLIILGLLGFFIFLFQKNNNKIYLISLFLIVLLWSYDTLGGYHWGETEMWIGSVYVRYLLIDFLFLAIFSSYFLLHLEKKVNLSLFKKFIPIILIFFFSWNLILLFTKPDNLNDTISQKERFYKINQVTEQLPNSAIIVTGFYDKAIISRKTLNYNRFSGNDTQKKESTLRLINNLLNEDYPVYLLEAEWHPATYLGLENYIRDKCDLPLIEQNRSLIEDLKFYEIIKP